MIMSWITGHGDACRQVILANGSMCYEHDED